MEHSFSYLYHPDELAAAVSQMAGETQIESVGKSRFHTTLEKYRSEAISLFTCRSSAIAINKAPSESHHVITLPLTKGCLVKKGGKFEAMSSIYCHLLSAEEPLILHTLESCVGIVAVVDKHLFHQYICRLFQDEKHVDLQSLNQAMGNYELAKAIKSTWSNLSQQTDTSSDDLNTLMMNELFYQLAMSVDHGPQRVELLMKKPRYLTRAEEYIAANLNKTITREELADQACVCIRTLSRAFNKFHNVGPLGFVKQRRMDAAYSRFLDNTTESVTVQQVATDLHFAHPGKFAIAYRESFGELPSTTLKR